jgi:uncharacterized membrane protein YbjE (DUF340 family)
MHCAKAYMMLVLNIVVGVNCTNSGVNSKEVLVSRVNIFFPTCFGVASSYHLARRPIHYRLSSTCYTLVC